MFPCEGDLGRWAMEPHANWRASATSGEPLQPFIREPGWPLRRGNRMPSTALARGVACHHDPQTVSHHRGVAGRSSLYADSPAVTLRVESGRCDLKREGGALSQSKNTREMECGDWSIHSVCRQWEERHATSQRTRRIFQEPRHRHWQLQGIRNNSCCRASLACKPNGWLRSSGDCYAGANTSARVDSSNNRGPTWNHSTDYSSSSADCSVDDSQCERRQGQTDDGMVGRTGSGR
jgi:hypothetical protein